MNSFLITVYTKDMVKSDVSVIREGAIESIAPRELVPGDIVRLSPGVKVAADCVLFFALELKIDMSALTGESLPVEKRVLENGSRDTEEAHESANMVFSSNVVVSGMEKHYSQISLHH